MSHRPRTRRAPVALGFVGLVLAVSLAIVAPVRAQDDGPEERDPIEGIVGIPMGNVCATQGTLVLLDTATRGSLPPELVQAVLDATGVVYSSACTIVPPRDRLTRCVGDQELADAGQGLIGIAPVGDAVQIVEELEGAIGADGLLSQGLIDALACEQFRFGQGTDDPDVAPFVPPTRPSTTTTTPPSTVPTPFGAGPDFSAPSPPVAGGGGVFAPAPTHPAALDDGESPVVDDEVAAPLLEPVAAVADQIDLLAVLVCLLLLALTLGALTDAGRRMVGFRRNR